MSERENLSIHPRNWRNMPFGRDKSNTSARKRRSTIERAIAGVSEHLERHPGDGMSRSRLAKLNLRLSDGNLV